MKGYIFSKQATIEGEREILGFGDEFFYVKEIDKKLADAE